MNTQGQGSAWVAYFIALAEQQRALVDSRCSEGVSALSAPATAPVTASLKFRRDRHLREFAQFPLPIRQSPENTFASLLGPENGLPPFPPFPPLIWRKRRRRRQSARVEPLAAADRAAPDDE